MLAAIGVLALAEAFRIRDPWLGARLMPAVVGVALVLLGAAHLTLPAGEARPWPDRFGWRRVVLVLALLAAYVVALPWTGFLPATAALAFLMLRGLGQFSWPVTLALTAAIAGASHLVFIRWLAMPLA